jgi:hypothetical protein
MKVRKELKPTETTNNFAKCQIAIEKLLKDKTIPYTISKMKKNS